MNVDPVDNHLEDVRERERLRKVFEKGLSTPVGFVLPLQRGAGKNGPEWQTGLWMLRGQHLFLVPGDSPVGLRLPLASLPWVAANEAPVSWPVDPMVNRGTLPVPERRSPADPIFQQRDAVRDRAPRPGESAPWIVRTALCVEARAGRMHIFMPPIEVLEDYIELLAAVEDTAAFLGIPVVIEGYTPPRDPRIRSSRSRPIPA